MKRRSVSLKEIRRRRGQDIVILFLSFCVAYVMMQSNIVGEWIAGASELLFLGSFISGIFFTSLFTLAPAIVALIELSHEAPLYVVALGGASGAVVGDLLLFLFLRDIVIVRMAEVLSGPWQHKWKVLLHHPLLQWLLPVAGIILYIIPFVPDEVGLSMLGLSRLRLALLIPLSFVINVISVTLLWFSVHALA